jgi:hypothetical protein
MGRRGPKPSHICRRGHDKEGRHSCPTCRRERRRAAAARLVPAGALVLAGVDNRYAKAWATRKARYGVRGGNVAPPKKECCKHGHPLTDDNLYWKRNKRGTWVRQCKMCNREYERSQVEWKKTKRHFDKMVQTLSNIKGGTDR